jgi:hypothetical protein
LLLAIVMAGMLASFALALFTLVWAIGVCCHDDAALALASRSVAEGADTVSRK